MRLAASWRLASLHASTFFRWKARPSFRDSFQIRRDAPVRNPPNVPHCRGARVQCRANAQGNRYGGVRAPAEGVQAAGGRTGGTSVTRIGPMNPLELCPDHRPRAHTIRKLHFPRRTAGVPARLPGAFTPWHPGGFRRNADGRLNVHQQVRRRLPRPTILRRQRGLRRLSF